MYAFKKSELFSRLLVQVQHRRNCGHCFQATAPQATPPELSHKGCDEYCPPAEKSNTYDSQPRLRAPRPPALHESVGGLVDGWESLERSTGGQEEEIKLK